MASLQANRVRGRTYWRIVESRRVNGKPRPIPVAYLGSADDLLARLDGSGSIQLQSKSHGAVAALHALALDLNIAGTIDRHLQESGRRVPDKKDVKDETNKSKTKLSPRKNDGLSVGESLMVIAIGRVCHATSKRGFAEWSKTTTLGELIGVDVERLNSQHFWDQIPLELISKIEAELVHTAIEKFQLPIETLLYDATNFYTFISTSNKKSTMPVRGHQKQKRDDLRQVSVALLCSKHHGIPLFHNTYSGNISDAKCFAKLIPTIKDQIEKLGANLNSVTLIYDKGNVSRANQQMVDKSQLYYVTSLTVASQRKLVNEANNKLVAVCLNSGEIVQAWRTKTTIWGVERTAVVLISERLLQGQMNGILQHVEAAKKWFIKLEQTLKSGKQRRSKERIKLDIEARLRGRQQLNKVMRFELTGEAILSLKFEFSRDELDRLAASTLGRIVLVTNRHDWSTADIVGAYRSQSEIEAAFADLKDNNHLSLRPQYHWTDQKIEIHVFTCILGLLLAKLLHLRALKAGSTHASYQSLCRALTEIRRARIAQSTNKKGRLKLITQLEDIEPEMKKLLTPLKINA